MRFICAGRVAALIALGTVVPLTGCGGGGGGGGSGLTFPIVAAKQIAPNTFQVGPGASWLPNPFGNAYSESLVSVHLALLNNGQPVPAGRVVEVRSAGQFQFNAAGDLSGSATGLLVNASGLALAPGSGSTVVPVSGATICTQPGTADPVPEDFGIPGDAVAAVVVPEGATAMRLSVADCFFFDNSVYAADPIRVIITLR